LPIRENAEKKNVKPILTVPNQDAALREQLAQDVWELKLNA